MSLASKVLIAFLFIFSFKSFAQSNHRSWMNMAFYPSSFDYSAATILINGDTATYEDLLKVHDTSVLKVEVYEKLKATKRNRLPNDQEAKVLLTTQAYVPYERPLATNEDSSEYYTVGADTVFVKIKSYATFDVDTSKRPWIRFLEKNLNAIVTAQNGAPPGFYTVTIRFLIDVDGSLSNFNVISDPGYGTAKEVLRLMAKSKNWEPAVRNGRPVKSIMTQKISFVVSEG